MYVESHHKAVTPLVLLVRDIFVHVLVDLRPGDRPEVVQPGLAEVLVDVGRVLQTLDQRVDPRAGGGVRVVHVAADDDRDGVGLGDQSEVSM